MEPSFWGLYLATGAFAGVMAGMLGVGGGLIIVPILAGLYESQGMTNDIIMHLALGTSLATIVVTSISSVHAHQKHQAVLWPVFWKLTPGILIGAWIGGWIASLIPSSSLKPVFAIFELLVAIQMISGRQPDQHSSLPNSLTMTSAGGTIGSISAIVGIGGGSLTVPFLLWGSINMRNAIATSAACGLPIAVAGSLSYIVAGWGKDSLPANTFGFVHLPAFFGIIIASVFFAPLGALLAHRLPIKTLKRIFAVFLIIVAGKLLLS
jgi:uncharacterized protein